MKTTKFLIGTALLGIAVAACDKPAPAPLELTAASYNMRCLVEQDSINGNVWGDRSKAIADVVLRNGFDVFGTQEGTPRQLRELCALLPGYKFTGMGREQGRCADSTDWPRDEFCAIYYRADDIDLLDSGTFWLSETPDKISRGWDAALNRICSWAQLRDRRSDREFYFFNLHLDHIGTVCVDSSAALVRGIIADKTLDGKIPAILTGDFNTDQRSAAYRAYGEGGALTDAYTLTDKRYAANGTFNAFDPTRFNDMRIDHIFVTPGTEVLDWATLTDVYWGADSTLRFPSDHFPVVAHIRVKE